MWNRIENRIARLEKQAAKKRQAAKVCNCRIRTRFHNAECLEALLEAMPLFCPLHGLRNFGRFWWTPEQFALTYRDQGPILPNGGDNELCPCPPHPWRSHVLKCIPGIGPRRSSPGWEEHDAARQAWLDLPPEPRFDPEHGRRRLEEDNGRAEAVMEKYWTWREAEYPPRKLR